MDGASLFVGFFAGVVSTAALFVGLLAHERWFHTKINRELGEPELHHFGPGSDRRPEGHPQGE